MPETPRAGDVLHCFIFGVVAQEFAPHGVQANRFEVAQRANAEHSVEGILQRAVPDVQIMTHIQNGHDFFGV